MSWTDFTLILLKVYIAYYAIVMLFDLLGKKAFSKNQNKVDPLFFSEEIEPIALYEKENEEASDQPNIGAPILSTGGIRLKDLFALVKEDAIEYTKTIPY